MYLHNGGAANCGGPVCLSMLAKRQAADKEGLDRLFNSGIIFPPPSASPDGEKNEKPEEQEKKGSDGEGGNGAKKKREKDSPDPTNKKNPGDTDKPVEKGVAQPEADKKKPEQSDSDNNSHEKKTKTPFKPLYAACWSPDAYSPELFEQINKRWWSSDSGNSQLSADRWPIDSTTPEATLLKSQLYQDPEKTRNNLISVKADETLKRDPAYIKLKEAEKRLNDTPGTKFLGNVLGEVGIGGNLLMDNILSSIGSLNKQAIEREEKELKIYHRNQAIQWCQERYWCREINVHPEKIGEKEELLVQVLAKDLANKRIEKGEYVDNLIGFQGIYSKPSCLLKPTKKILSSSVTDAIIKAPLSFSLGKPGTILGHSIIYGKDKLVEEIDTTLNKHEKQNRLTDISKAVAIRKLADEYMRVEAAKFRQLINGFNHSAESKGTTSGVTNNELPIILPRVSEKLTHSLE
jgi:hypothetical protein